MKNSKLTISLPTTLLQKIDKIRKDLPECRAKQAKYSKSVFLTTIACVTSTPVKEPVDTQYNDQVQRNKRVNYRVTHMPKIFD